MDIKVRELEFRDIFSFAKIAKKINIKNIVKKAMENNNLENLKEEEIKALQEEKGLEIIVEIFTETGEAEKEVCKFIGNITGLKIEDVQKWKLKDLKEFVKQFMEINDFSDLKDFFMQAID